jgi:hypothetical protein
MRPFLRSVVRPTVLLPLLLAAALLTFAFKLGGVEGTLARIRAVPVRVLWLTPVFAAVYLALKAIQLRMLLSNLGLRIPWPNFGLAYCVGELTATLPFGLFSQNWVMSASSHVHAGRSAGATVMMLLTEAFVVLAVLALIGIPGWGVVRVVALVVLAGMTALVLGVLRYEHVTLGVAYKVRHEPLRKAVMSGIELLGSLKRLSRAPLLAANVLLAAGYLAALAYGFLVVGRGMGLAKLDYAQAVVIYSFALAVVLLGAGAFGQIGTVDVLGMVAASASGIGYGDGLALMIGFRIVWTASLWLLDLPVVALLWRFLSVRSGRSRGSGQNRQKALH